MLWGERRARHAHDDAARSGARPRDRRARPHRGSPAGADRPSPSGCPRATNRRMSAPHGTPARRATPRSSATAASVAAVSAWSVGVRALANIAPGQVTVTGGPPSSDALATARSTAALASAIDSPMRTGARPSNTRRSGTVLDHSPASIRPTETGYGSARPAISGSSTAAFTSRLQAVERAMDRQVAIDRRDALRPEGRVGRDAVDLASERDRAGLRADDVEPGRLRDQARVPPVVLPQRGERPDPAVLLGGDRQEGRVDRPASDRSAAAPRARAGRRPTRLSCPRPRGRGALRPGRLPTTATRAATVQLRERPRRRGRRWPDAGGQQPASAAVLPGARRAGREAPSCAPPPPGARCPRGPHPGRSWSSAASSPSATALSRRCSSAGALVTGDAGDPDERREIGSQLVRVQRSERRLHPAHGVASSAARSSCGASAAAWARRTALDSARA